MRIFNAVSSSVLATVCMVSVATAQATASRTSSTLRDAESGPNHRWMEASRSTAATGDATSLKRYALLANGLNIMNATGKWQQAAPAIRDVGDFIVCTGASFRVVLNANLSSYGAVDIESSDQKRIVSHPLGIGFYDPESGRSVLLAQIKNSQAELVSSNMIVFRDAFEGSGIKASVTYTYRIGRFSQDVIFERSPSVSPADFDMGKNTRLEVLTEIVESPTPVRTSWVMKRETDESKRARMVEPDLIDEKLDYGAMAMYLGRAFASNSSKRSGIPVAKRLLDIEGRIVLAEAVEWRDVVAKLDVLPRQASASSANRQAALKRDLPALTGNTKLPSFESRLARAATSNKLRMATLTTTVPNAFVLDYELVESVEEFTFESGQTYLVEDEVVIDGLATFEAGAVIKYAPGAKLSIAGTVYGPEGTVVFTSKHDNSAGAQINGSTGVPIGSYADTALAFYYVYYAYLGYLDIRFADTGVYCYGGSWVIHSSSFLDCTLGVYASAASISLGPADMCNVDTWHDHDYDGSISPSELTECATDRDADGLSESWELQHFGRLDQNGASDFDGDGQNNLQEFQNETDPNTINFYPRFTSLFVNSSSLNMTC